eukprot:scaffold19769_cov63-Phaeocystis_antarctica.AAC.11
MAWRRSSLSAPRMASGSKPSRSLLTRCTRSPSPSLGSSSSSRTSRAATPPVCERPLMPPDSPAESNRTMPSALPTAALMRVSCFGAMAAILPAAVWLSTTAAASLSMA